ncbi:MAG TPA: hypothetical protein DCX89_05880 [Saprospirales bacterium]|nr:hypothetical protein [Saprospirales bacterium]
MYIRMLIMILALYPLLISAQIEFKHDRSLNNNLSTRSTLSVGITDINGDYKDDIILLNNGQQLITAQQNAEGLPFTIHQHGMILENPAWALSVGDLNNDGIAEIFTCGISTFGRIFTKNQNGQYDYTQQLFNLSFPQNSNMADINNDGWLDLFVCDEVGYSDIFLNNQSGQLSYNDYIDFTTSVPSDNSGNYGSEWVDFDDDRDLDLFITKCKPVATSPEDPRRINVLFVNDGNNKFSEQAEIFGLKNGDQSWTGTFGDVDNDGDLDCFVSNHDSPHILYENNNGFFENKTTDWITAEESVAYQAVMRDFDNNGYNDIFVSGSRNLMWWNLGNDVWQLENEPFGPLAVFSFATGDLNDDGFLDIVASYGVLNSPGKYNDRIWLNKGNDNHYLKISLKGTTSNSKGIGAKVKLFSAIGIQVQDARIGESYGTTNSSNLHFGTGLVSMIDSIHIYWPSGTIDKYYEVAVDQHLLAHEGFCLKPFFNILPEGKTVLCDDQEVLLEIPFNLNNIQWSTGANTPSVSIAEDNQISVGGHEADGCFRASNIKSVLYTPDQTPDVYFVEGSEVNCPGETVKIMASPATDYLWNTGETTQSISVTESGVYTLKINGDCQEFTSAAIHILFTDPLPPVLENDTLIISEAQELTISAEGASVFWFRDASGVELIHSGGVFNAGYIASDTTFYVAGLSEFFGPERQTGMVNHQGTPYSGNNINSGLIFTVFKDIILEKVKVYTQHSGYRTIELKQTDVTSGLTSIIGSRRIYIDPQTSYIDLDFEILPGKDYVLTTNADSNMVHQGMQSPRLFRSNSGANFPYILENVTEITTTVHGPANYYYFYDWKIKEKQAECLSELIPVHILLQTHVRNDADESVSDLTIYPNPATGYLYFKCPSQNTLHGYSIEILDPIGKTIQSKSAVGGEKIFIGDLTAGMYFLRVRASTENCSIFTKKFIVQ